MQKSEKDTITINFVSLFQIIWKEKISFIIIILLFIGLGFWYAFTAREEFVSEGKILPELQSKGKIGGLAGLASLAGVDLAGVDATEAIRPDLYPDVLKSTPFFLELFKEKITTRENKVVIFEQFYHEIIEKGVKIEKKSIESSPVKEHGFLIMNRLVEKRIKDLKARVQVNIDKKSGIISISVKMPDPITAACVARFSMVYLTNYITRYRIDKAKKDLYFLEEKLNLAKGKFYNNQTKKAQYSDQFQLPTIRLHSADLQRERIESEYRISSTFYSELLKKYEEAKIKVQQETPVFQILEPPSAPAQKSEPRKAIMILIATFLGGFAGIIIILIKRGNYKRIIEI